MSPLASRKKFHNAESTVVSQNAESIFLGLISNQIHLEIQKPKRKLLSKNAD